MKTLTLLRHAKSGWDDPVARDFDRPLNARGRTAARAMGREMRALGLALRPRPRLARRARDRDARASSARAMAARSTPDFDERIYLASADDPARRSSATPTTRPSGCCSSATIRASSSSPCCSPRRRRAARRGRGQISDRRARRDRLPVEHWRDVAAGERHARRASSARAISIRDARAGAATGCRRSPDRERSHVDLEHADVPSR